MDVPFKPRAERVFRQIYPSMETPTFHLQEDRAAWIISRGEIWTTNGEFDRLTRLALATHHQRIQASIHWRNDGIQVSLASTTFAPESPAQHHPGLGDLISRAYQLGGRPSDQDRLQRRLDEATQIIRDLQPLISIAMIEFDPGENPQFDSAAERSSQFLKGKQ